MGLNSVVQDRLPWLASLSKILQSWESNGRECPSDVVGKARGMETARSKGSDTRVQSALSGSDILSVSRDDNGVQSASWSDTRVQSAPSGSNGATKDGDMECRISRNSDGEVQITRGADTALEETSGGDLGSLRSSRGHDYGIRGVLACSALKRDYRKILASGVKGEELESKVSSCVFVMLKGTKALIGERMRGREHFMPPGLLQSQFDSLELPTAQEGNALIVVTDISATVPKIVEYIVTELAKLSL